MSSSDKIALLVAGLTLASLIAAFFAARYGRDSAVAARDAVEPLKEMAARLADSVASLARLLESNQTLGTELGAALSLAERMRAEDRLVQRLARYERIMTSIQRMWEGLKRMQDGLPQAYLREAQGDLRAALAPVPIGELSACRALAGQMITGAVGESLQAADIEIREAIDRTHRELAGQGGKVSQRGD